MLLLAIAIRRTEAQPARVRTSGVRIEVILAAPDSAAVQEEYTLVSGSGALSFQYLSDPCATVGPVRITSNGTPVPYATEANVPWVMLHDTSVAEPDRDSSGVSLSYAVRLRGGIARIPLILPAATLLSVAGRRDAVVALSVSVTGRAGGARVTLPQMQPNDAANRWVGHYLAVPSIVRVQTGTSDAGCERRLGGDSGGLEWRFVVFTGTMVLWVPLYLWWVSRRREDDA
jgi:hypothetical protein